MSDRRPARPSLRGGSSKGGTGRKGSAFIRGEAGMRRTDEEIENQKRRAEERKNATGKPFRFYTPVGETRQIIICDDKPDFFLYEHALKDSEGRWGRLFTGCIKEHDNCPVCIATGKESYYAMILTVIDLTPFETRDGDTVEFSRKLLVVKPAQQKKFLRFYNKEGTLRGALFDMTRDGDKDSSIGNDIEFVEFVDEDELATYTRSWKDREGKKHNENCSEPYVYEDIFEEPTAENLAAVVGADPQPGSRASNERELGRGSRGSGSSRTAGRSSRSKSDDWEDDKEDRKFGRGSARKSRDEEPEDEAEEEEAPRRPARRGREEPPARPARRSAKAEEPDEDAEDEAEDPPRRGRTARSEPPARSTRTRRAEPEDEPDEEDEEDEAPPPRRAARPAAKTAAKPAARSTSRRAPPEDDDIDDDIPF